ncbi:hypothetical protein [Qipengyuania spongiae]|uniref:Circumsporozoite protein n=1 Tax=Qipengyuania spongiae TaxID=2909673 RepID=A0ABY5SZ46_9SPHN|nr:hypothetical protein [Qipengyuania spongiae]UVI39788.1 hypothetical protein L1F33_02155 [Qipengyuania spongiae]
MKFRIALAAPALLALGLAACGSSDDASTEAEVDTVEIPANDALEGVNEAPVVDADATVTTEPSDVRTTDEAAANEAQGIEDAGNNAADTAAAAMDEMDLNE